MGLDAGYSWAAPYLHRYEYGLLAISFPAHVRVFAGFIGGALLGLLAGAFSGNRVNWMARTLIAKDRHQQRAG